MTTDAIKRLQGALQTSYDPITSTGLKIVAWIAILTHGEPDILGALVELIGRIGN